MSVTRRIGETRPGLGVTRPSLGESRPYSLYATTPGANGSATPESMAAAMRRSVREPATPLNVAFFGTANVDALQREIQVIIGEKLGVAIDRQSDEQLLIAMRSVYALYAAPSGDARRETQRLNGIVLGEVLPIIAGNVRQYLTYLKDASTLPEPIPRGLQTSVKGDKTVALFRPI